MACSAAPNLPAAWGSSSAEHVHSPYMLTPDRGTALKHDPEEQHRHIMNLEDRPLPAGSTWA